LVRDGWHKRLGLSWRLVGRIDTLDLLLGLIGIDSDSQRLLTGVEFTSQDIRNYRVVPDKIVMLRTPCWPTACGIDMVA